MSKLDEKTGKIARKELLAIAETMIDNEIRSVMTTEQSAEYLQVSTQLLEIMRTKGGGPPFAKLGRLVRYRRETLDAWVKQNEVAHTSALGATE